jgi:hypothetical protein
VIRIPDDWNGHLMTAGTPGIRDAFSSDFILSDHALEKGWAYVSQDPGDITLVDQVPVARVEQAEGSKRRAADSHWDNHQTD